MGMLEAMSLGVPVIATYFGGNTDFVVNRARLKGFQKAYKQEKKTEGGEDPRTSVDTGEGQLEESFSDIRAGYLLRSYGGVHVYAVALR